MGSNGGYLLECGGDFKKTREKEAIGVTRAAELWWWLEVGTREF